MESEMTDAMNPMKARRSSHKPRECFDGSGIDSDKKLYYYTVSILPGDS
jgi:hypothetical protein